MTMEQLQHGEEEEECDAATRGSQWPEGICPAAQRSAAEEHCQQQVQDLVWSADGDGDGDDGEKSQRRAAEQAERPDELSAKDETAHAEEQQRSV